MKYRFRSNDELILFARYLAQALGPTVSETRVAQTLAAAATGSLADLVDPTNLQQVFPHYPRALSLDQTERHALRVLKPLRRAFGVDTHHADEQLVHLYGAYLTALVESRLPEEVVAVRRRGYLEGFSLAGELALWADILAEMPPAAFLSGLMQPILYRPLDSDPFPLLPPFLSGADMQSYRIRSITACARAVVDLEGAVGCALAIPCRFDEQDAIAFVDEVLVGGGLFLSVQLGPRAIEAHLPLQEDGAWGPLEHLSDLEAPTLDVMSFRSGVPPSLQPRREAPPGRVHLPPERCEALVTRLRGVLKSAGYRATATLLRTALAQGLGFASVTEQLAPESVTTSAALNDLGYLERDALLGQILEAVLHALSKRSGRIPADVEMQLIAAMKPALDFTSRSEVPADVQSRILATLPNENAASYRLH